MLLARGHQLATRCDTEAWVHLYEDLGERMFDEARGQFAVSLWDRKNRTLILGRDRVGICPLYYAERDGWLLWASEIKALLSSGLVRAEADSKGIDHLFSFFCAGTTRTCFEGVKSLPPGHFLRVRDGRVSIHQYWDLDFPDKGDERRGWTTLGPSWWTSWNISSARPSSAGAARRRPGRQLHQRRAGFHGRPGPQLPPEGQGGSVVHHRLRQRRAGRARGIDRGGQRPGIAPDDRDDGQRPRRQRPIPELVVAAEGPVLDTSCAALLRLAQAVHEQGYKVALTGEGADEALAGYVWFKGQMIRNTLLKSGSGRRR